MGVLLPVLEPRIHVAEEIGAYGYRGEAPTASIDPETFLPIANNRIAGDNRFHDVTTIFEREVKNSITQSVGEKKGILI